MSGASISSSPWMTSTDAATYLKRGKKFLLREIRAGRLKAARVGGRGEILTRAEWCDEWVAGQAIIVPVPLRTRR